MFFKIYIPLAKTKRRRKRYGKLSKTRMQFRICRIYLGFAKSTLIVSDGLIVGYFGR